jgi:response regulator NasT
MIAEGPFRFGALRIDAADDTEIGLGGNWQGAGALDHRQAPAAEEPGKSELAHPLRQRHDRGESRRVLLIAQDNARAAVVERALTHAGHRLVGHARSVQALLEQVARLQANLVIADLDAANAEALQQFGRLSERAPCPIVVFTGDENTHAIRAAVEAGVSSYVVDGFGPTRIDPILQVAVARHEKEWAMRAERDVAQAKLAERKVIERAKGILMRKRGIGEDEAYHMLRRVAMDQSLRMREVAERVISMSDLLG